MMNPNANEMPSRSAPVIAGTALPASTRVATTEPGPTRTRAAVPSVSATALCALEYITRPPAYDYDSTLSNLCRTTLLPPKEIVNRRTSRLSSEGAQGVGGRRLGGQGKG